MQQPRRIVMHCPCRNGNVLAKGLCGTGYTLQRQDEAYCGGPRELVPKRDDFRCRVPGCTTTQRGRRDLAVQHREPGNTDAAKMVMLCLTWHTKLRRTLSVEGAWPVFLGKLWREQHATGQEQSARNFGAQPAIAVARLLRYQAEENAVLHRDGVTV